MGEITIKLGDEKLIRRISDLARRHHRTPQSEVEELLRKAVFPKRSRAQRAVVAERISRMTPSDRQQSNSTQLVGEDRSR